MKFQTAKLVPALAMVTALNVSGGFAQSTSGKRNFDAEIQAALESAKTAAGFEEPGTW